MPIFGSNAACESNSPKSALNLAKAPKGRPLFWLGAPPRWLPSRAQGRHTNSGLVALSAPRGSTLSGTVCPSRLSLGALCEPSMIDFDLTIGNYGRGFVVLLCLIHYHLSIGGLIHISVVQKGPSSKRETKLIEFLIDLRYRNCKKNQISISISMTDIIEKFVMPFGSKFSFQECDE